MAEASSWMRDLHGRATSWLRGQPAYTGSRTAELADLAFAFGFARTGEPDEAERLLTSARASLSSLRPPFPTLYLAYEHRVRQALMGLRHEGELAREWHDEYTGLGRLERFAVDRLRMHSSILEPDQRTNPYRHWGARINEFERELSELSDIFARDEFVRRTRGLLGRCGSTQGGWDGRVRILRVALGRAVFVGEEFARELTRSATSEIESGAATNDHQMAVLEGRLLLVAAKVAIHFGWRDQFLALLDFCESRIPAYLAVAGLPAAVLDGCVDGLFRLGFLDRADQFLQRACQLVLSGNRLDDWLEAATVETCERLLVLMSVAAGWYGLGQDSPADLTLARAHALLNHNATSGSEAARLAEGVAKAVRLARCQPAATQLHALFDSSKKLEDRHVTVTHYNLSQMKLLEAVVLTAVEVCRRG